MLTKQVLYESFCVVIKYVLCNKRPNTIFLIDTRILQIGDYGDLTTEFIHFNQ